LDSRAVKHFFFGGNGGGWLGKNAQGLFRKDEVIFKKAFDVFKERQRSTFSEKNGRWQMAVRENNRKYHE
jgi:hypothetical protein